LPRIALETYRKVWKNIKIAQALEIASNKIGTAIRF